MKILKVENIIVIQDDKKKYKRVGILQSDGSEFVEWKSVKSNHTINNSKQKELEGKFKNMLKRLDSKKGISIGSIAGNGRVSVNLNKTKTAIMDLEVKKLIESGKKLDAVKHVKEVAGLGLREAKDYVEDYARKNNIQDRRWK